MSATVIRKDIMSLKKVYSRIQAAAGRVVAVGFPAEKQNAYPDGTPVATVAAVQVFGSPAQNIPARDFMSMAQPDLRRCQHEIATQIAGRKLDPAQVDAALKVLGERGMADIKKAIIDLTMPPLKESTLEGRRAKGNYDEKPLIDTHHLVDSATYVVRDN